MADITQQENLIIHGELKSEGDDPEYVALSEDEQKRVRKAYIRNNNNLTFVITGESGVTMKTSSYSIIEMENNVAISFIGGVACYCGEITPEDYQDDSPNVE